MNIQNLKRAAITIDAANETAGRIATRVAFILMGKNKVGYRADSDMGGKVTIKNAQEIKFTGKKMITKEYKHHSMHPGGLKIKLAKNLIKDKPQDIIIHAVSKMLPKNKFRAQRLKRIKFE